MALVGGAEAPIVPEIIEGYRVMGALAEDEALMALDGSDTVDNRRACRPFGNNCGFTVAEAAVYAVVCDDALAVELGANIHCAAPALYVNADGFKKSISSPGVGNYVTMAKAMSMARTILGEDSCFDGAPSCTHTAPAPRRTASPSPASWTNSRASSASSIGPWQRSSRCWDTPWHQLPGDQLACALGTWAYDRVPGITTIDAIADDVSHDHLRLPTDHFELPGDDVDAIFVNSKGFGGNNATGLFLSPAVTRRMLEKKHGARALDRARREECRRSRAGARIRRRDDAGRGRGPVRLRRRRDRRRRPRPVRDGIAGSRLRVTGFPGREESFP